MVSQFTESQEATPKRAPNVFLLDDEPGLLVLASLILAHEGYNVDSASDGRMALERIQSNLEKYDVVISDYCMPEINGKELIAILKRTGFQGKTVIYSGCASKNDEEWRASLGVDAVVPKPGTAALLAILGKLTKWN